jgi:hypothetical protein
MTLRTVAHVIPESIGGRLSAEILCKRCNSDMGTSEALLAQDVSVRVLVDSLEDRLPTEIVARVRYRQNYFTDHRDYGRVDAGMNKRAELVPKESATIKGDERTLDQALAELDRLGASDERRAALRTEFDDASPGDWIDVRPGYRIQRLIDWTDVKFKPALNDPLVPLHVPVGIAYLYLALCLRNAIYNEALDPVRAALQAAIKGDTAAAEAYCPANRCGTRVVEPTHMLRAKKDGSGVLVLFHVFRDLCWPVHFPDVALAGEQTLYWIDLAVGTEWWATKTA